MLSVTIEVDAPPGQAIGIKEALTMYLERWGDCRVISVDELVPRQMQMKGVDSDG